MINIHILYSPGLRFIKDGCAFASVSLQRPCWISMRISHRPPDDNQTDLGGQRVSFPMAECLGVANIDVLLPGGKGKDELGKPKHTRALNSHEEGEAYLSLD